MRDVDIESGLYEPEHFTLVWKHTFAGLWGCTTEEVKYQEFMRKENNVLVHIVGCTVGVIVNALVAFSSMYEVATTQYLGFVAVRFALAVLYFVEMVCVCNDKYKFCKLAVHTVYIGDAMCLFYSICYGVFILGMSLPDCNDPQGRYQACDGEVPADLYVVYVLNFTVISLLVKCRHLGIVIVSALIENCILIASAIIIGLTHRLGTAILLTIFVQFLVFYAFEDYSRRVYLYSSLALSSHKAMLTALNEAALQDMRTVELGNLYGNIAHDMKTPLQAFCFEMDIILSVCDSAEYDKGCDKSCERSLKQIKRAVEVMRTTYNFMHMSMNRALDFAKAASGVGLHPAMGTVSINDTLKLVDSSLRALDTDEKSTTVIVNTASTECDIIITDKQWLFDNILGLASNAHKYSAGDTVIIKCSLCSSRSINEFYGYQPYDLVETPCAQNDSTTVAPSILEDSFSDLPSHQEMLLFEVTDNGPGISKEDVSVVFQPLRNQSTRRTGGTGTALYVLALRVRCLGGQCGISAREDGAKGARVWFTIPYLSTSDREAASFVAGSPPHGVARDTHTPVELLCIDEYKYVDRKLVESETVDSLVECGLEKQAGIVGYELSDITASVRRSTAAARVLVVDDSAVIRKTSTRAFQNAGIAADVAIHGLDCLEKVLASAEQYDLILMDIQMPCMDGLECAKRLRQMERDRQVKGAVMGGPVRGVNRDRLVIVGISANSDYNTRMDALAAGMDGFMTKPVQLSTLKTCLRAVGCDVLQGYPNNGE